jgi:Na+/melibiose symporter-like transporter
VLGPGASWALKLRNYREEEGKLKEPPPAPVSKIATYSAASFGVNMVNAFSNHALPLFLGRYHLPKFLVGVLAQQDSSLGGIEQPFIGLLSDRTRTRWGRRRPFFIVGVPLVVACLIFLSTHPPIWAVVATLTVFASFLALANDPYKALLGDLFPSSQRGRVGAALGLTNMLGQIAMLAVAALLWTSNESLVMYVVAFGLTASFIITFLGVKEPEVVAPAPKLRGLDVKMYARELASHHEFAKYSLAQLFFWLGNGGAVPFLTRFGVEVLGVSEGQSFFLVGLLVVSTAIFAVPAGWLGDRLGKKYMLSWGLVVFAVVAMVGSQANGFLQGVVVMVAVGIPNAIVISLSFPLFTDLMPRGRIAEFTGFSALVTSFSEAVGAGLVGGFVDLTGNFRFVFVATGLLFLASFFVLRTVHPERAQAQRVVEVVSREEPATGDLENNKP